jgi:hypothetical protein
MRSGKIPKSGSARKAIWQRSRVFKFRSGEQLYLPGYTLDECVRLNNLEAVGRSKTSIET